MITPISDKQAASLAGKRYETIRNAVKRGALTRIPTAGQVQHVSREQVELYIGKTQIRLDALSKQELAAWQRYEQEILNRAPGSQGETAAPNLALPAAAVAGLSALGIAAAAIQAGGQGIEVPKVDFFQLLGLK